MSVKVGHPWYIITKNAISNGRVKVVSSLDEKIVRGTQHARVESRSSVCLKTRRSENVRINEIRRSLKRALCVFNEIVFRC